MDTRKIIAFGKSSHVISLPKKWLDQYHLKKGDVVFLEQEAEKLAITPEVKENEKEEKHVVIDVSKKTYRQVLREIISAYINYTDYIVIQGKDLPKFSSEITDAIHNLVVALEIVEQSSTKIVARDFLRISDVNVQEYIKKMDITIRSMLIDLHDASFTDYEGVAKRLDNIERIYILLLKTFKAVFNDVSSLSRLSLPFEKIPSYYRYNYSLRDIGVNLKGIAQEINNLSPKAKTCVQEALKVLDESYVQLMRCVTKEDKERALMLSEREVAREKIIDVLEPVKGETTSILFQMLWILKELHEMGHRVYS